METVSGFFTQQFRPYIRCPFAMTNRNRPESRAIAIQRNDDPTVELGQARQFRMQRVAVAMMGCLWILAFATGCSRNTKNCSAYDGVQFECVSESNDRQH